MWMKTGVGAINRFNQGVVTVNLVDIGLSAQGDIDKFWKIFDDRMQLCHRALQARHERLTGTVSDAAPHPLEYGALLRLKKGCETIDKYLRRVFHPVARLCGALGMRQQHDRQKALQSPRARSSALK